MDVARRVEATSSKIHGEEECRAHGYVATYADRHTRTQTDRPIGAEGFGLAAPFFSSSLSTFFFRIQSVACN